MLTFPFSISDDFCFCTMMSFIFFTSTNTFFKCYKYSPYVFVVLLFLLFAFLWIRLYLLTCPAFASWAHSCVKESSIFPTCSPLPSHSLILPSHYWKAPQICPLGFFFTYWVKTWLLIEFFYGMLELFFSVDNIHTIPDLLAKQKFGIIEGKVDTNQGLA